MSGFNQGLLGLACVDQALPKPTVAARCVSDSQDGTRVQLTRDFFGIPTAIPEALLDFTNVAALLGYSQAILADCDRKNLPARKLPPLPKYVLVNTEAGQAKEESVATEQAPRRPESGEWTAENPFYAPIINATWLTHSAQTASNIASRKETWGEARRVIQVDIGISGSQIQYMPGDSFGILAPNPAYIVESLCERAGEGLESTIEMGTCSKISCTLRELLTYKLDLSSLPRKNNVYALAQYCSDPQEKRCLEWLCSKCPVGKELWKQFVEEQGLGFGELVLLFPSCVLPLGAVIAHSGPAVPRYYSVASSPLVHCQHISIALSIVHRKSNMACKPDQVIRRAGLCTSYIEWASRQYLYSGLAGIDPAVPAGATPPELRIFHKSNTNFHLPGSVAPPLILIGPGTGVAPFVGFLHHRTAIECKRLLSCDDACEGVWRGGFEIEEELLAGESSNVHQFISETLPGPIHLFFGCRNEDDYLYKNDLQGHLTTGALTTLEVAMSRTQDDKIYVTHLLKQRGAEMARLLVNEGAYVYVCGDGNHMAKDVNTALLQILQEHAGMSEACAIEKIANLKLKRRYLQDIWS